MPEGLCSKDNNNITVLFQIQGSAKVQSPEIFKSSKRFQAKYCGRM